MSPIFRIDLIFSENEESEEVIGVKTEDRERAINFSMKVSIPRRKQFDILRKEIENLFLSKNPIVHIDPALPVFTGEWAEEFARILSGIVKLLNKDDLKAREDHLRIFLGIQNAGTVNRNLKALESLGLIESRPIPGEHLKKYGFRSGRVFSSPSGPKSCPPLPPERPSGVRLTPIRQDLLRRTVVRKAEEFALAPGKIWYLLMDAFRMPSHLHLAPEFFERALLYLETLHLPGETRTKKISALNSSTIIGGRG